MTIIRVVAARSVFAVLVSVGLVSAVLALSFVQSASAQNATVEGGLDRLFERLIDAESPAQASVIEDEIWRLWLKSGSSTVDLIMTRGLEALKEQNYAVALDMFSTAIELAPDYPEAWNKRATLYYVIDDYDAAIADVSQVLAREPRHWPALMGLAVMLDDLDQKEPALGAYRQALKINPQLEDAQDAIDRLKVDVEGRGI